MKVLVCGGGVIGTTLAYFLSRRSLEVVVVECAGIANAASGKSGGFLALDWCSGSPLDQLARRSFALHAELAASLGRDWGYRRVDTLGVVASAYRDVSRYRNLTSPPWLGVDSVVRAKIGTPATTAQLHPAAFTRAMMAAACENGVSLVEGRVEGLLFSPGRVRATGALVDGAELNADVVVIAMGPWSLLACRWLPLPAIHGLKGHSVIFAYRPTPESLFVELEWEAGSLSTPEINPRPDGTTYVCGLPGHEALPADPAAVSPEADAIETLRRMTAQVSPGLGAAKILAEQACFRPVTQDGLPLVGAVPGIAGAYIATGHSVWGMLNAPGTGESLAQMIVGDSDMTTDLRAFDPARLTVLDPWSLPREFM